jgi:hypothetical protein
MVYRQCFFLVEGFTDQIFVEKVILPALAGKYDHIEQPRTYQGDRPKDRRWLFHSWSRRGDLYVLADLRTSPCISAAKERAKRGFDNAQVEGRTIIVVPEIEAWYVGAMTAQFCQQHEIAISTDISPMDTAAFENLRQRANFSSGLDFMKEILKQYDLVLARGRNPSLDYFCQRIGL